MDIKLQKKGLDIEIKAKYADQKKARDILKTKKAKFLGKFNMQDTYFNVKKGRLKARIGDIKDILIQYNRENKKHPKRSDFLVSVIDKNSNIIPSLKESLGIKVVVKKQREIYVLNNIRFHTDIVRGLGKFIEIEARGEKESELKTLRKQMKEWLELLGIEKKDLIAWSYSDLLLKK